MAITEVVTDDHLSKFPPLKKPDIGKCFDVDDNVVAGKPPTVHSYRVVRLQTDS